MSSDSTRLHETTTQTVPPGRETGMYHIPVSNLPLDVTWRTLKDFVRTVCTVDYVEVFPESTSGWVRVEGRENFKAAFALLNGGSFGGRKLFANGKNEDHPLVLKHLIFPPALLEGDDTCAWPITLVPPQSLPPPPVTPRFTNSVPAFRPDAPIFSPTMPHRSMYIPWTPSPSSNYLANPPIEYAVATAPRPYPTYAAGPVVSQPAPMMMASAPAQTYLPSVASPQIGYGLSRDLSSYYQEGLSLTESRRTEPRDSRRRVTRAEYRKISIRNLPRHANEQQIRKMIQDCVGAADAEMIAKIYLPHGTATSHRSNAETFVLFSSEDAALRAVNHLEGHEIGKRTIEAQVVEPVIVMVKPAGERRSSVRGDGGGDSGVAGGGSGHHQHSQSPDDERGEKKDDKKKDKAKERSSKPSSGSLSSRPAPSLGATFESVIAPSGGGSASQSTDMAGKDRSGNTSDYSDDEKETIVVVDGSSSDGYPTDLSENSWSH